MPNKLTLRERILKQCTAKKGPGKGETLTFGKREFRSNRRLEVLNDKEWDKLFKDKGLGLGAYVREAEKAETMLTAAKAKKSTSTLESKPCECGCKVMTRKGSRFLPGHDMKLKSALRKAATAGDKKAKEELLSRGWGLGVPKKVKPKAKPKTKVKS